MPLLGDTQQGDPLTFTAFQERVRAGEVRTAEILEGEGIVSGEFDDGESYEVTYPTEVQDELGRTLSLVAPPVQFEGEPYRTRRGPRHGEHTDEVLAEVSYEMDEILQLKIDGAIH